MEYKVNEIIDSKFVLIKPMGVGAYSEVWLAINTAINIYVVLKLYKPSSELVQNYLGRGQWSRAVCNIHHKNVLLPLSANVYNDKLYIVLPYCKNGSISRRVGTFTERQTWKLLYDVSGGLSVLHNMNPPIIHQNLKPDNILIDDDGDFVISDFGIDSIIKNTYNSEKTYLPCGNCTYQAPELFTVKGTYLASCDIYSLGVVAFEMISGDPPFGDYGGSLQLRGEVVPTLGNGCSDVLRMVIERCLRENPNERLTAKQLHNYAELAVSGQIEHLKRILPRKRKWYHFFIKAIFFR